MLNDVAIEAIETRRQRITDEALERYKPCRRGDFPMIDDDDAEAAAGGAEAGQRRTALVVVQQGTQHIMVSGPFFAKWLMLGTRNLSLLDIG